MKNFNKIILSLGSNIGDRKLHLENAVNEISKIANLIKISSVYESDPILYDDQDKFLNIILEIEFENSSIKLLEKTKDILAPLGTLKSHQLLVGFALETNDEVANAIKKLKSKNLDLIVLNSLNDQGAGF